MVTDVFFVELPMNFACFCINFAVAMVTRFCYYGNREGAELSVADTSVSEKRQEERTLLMALNKRGSGHCAVAAQPGLSLWALWYCS